MGWQLVGTGTNLNNLSLAVPDRGLRPGELLYIEMELSGNYASAFDSFGAEKLFSAPAGTKIKDVYGAVDGGRQLGVVVLEGLPATSGATTSAIQLAVILGFIAANWLTIVIASLVITAIVIGIRALMQISGGITETIQSIPGVVWLGLIGVGGYMLLKGRKGGKKTEG